MQTSIRLNQHDRGNLVRALSGRFDDKEQWIDLVRRSKQLCWTVYQLAYDADTLARINRLPAGWLPTQDYVLAQFGDSTNNVKLHFNGLSRFLPTIKEKDIKDQFPPERAPYLAQDYFNMEAVKIKKTSPLFKEFNSISIDAEKLEKAREEVEKEIRQMIYSSSTTKALVERWPEVAPIVAQVVTPYAIADKTLPAPIIKGLNKKLKLVA